MHTRHALIALAALFVAVSVAFAPACGGTEEDEIKSYEDPHGDLLDGDESSAECENAVEYLYEQCYMDWEDGVDFQYSRCILGGYETWRKCMIDAATNSTDCSEAIELAEQCKGVT